MAFTHYLSIVHPETGELIIGAETSERLLHDIEFWDGTGHDGHFMIAINSMSNPTTVQWGQTPDIYTKEKADACKKAICQFVIYQSDGLYKLDFARDEIKDFVNQIRLFDAAVKSGYVIGFILHEYPYVTISEIKSIPESAPTQHQGIIE